MAPGMQIERISLNDVTLSAARRPGLDASGRRALVVLHGWPGTRIDWNPVLDRLRTASEWDAVELLAPDLCGFGESDKPTAELGEPEPYARYSPAAHVGDLCELVDRVDATEVIVAGYDLGANLAQGLARKLPGRVSGLLLCDPVHAAARAQAARMNLAAELWYQQLHLQPWASQLIAHDRQTVEVYLRHFYVHWWGAGAVEEAHFQRLVDLYSAPGAFDASIGWYRSRAPSRAKEAHDAALAEPIDVPASVVWGEVDPVTPVGLAETLDQSFRQYELLRLPGVGHFAPLEAPDEVSAALSVLARGLGWLA